MVNVVITTESNTVILPSSQYLSPDAFMRSLHWYEVPGYNSLSKNLRFDLKEPYVLTSDQRLFLKYGEDMANTRPEEDNRGAVCCHVYALYVD